MEYSKFWQLQASFFRRSKQADKNSSFTVATYSNYAWSFDEFAEKYPTFTVETVGTAFSEGTVGDIGEGHFGSVTFDTKVFGNEEYHDEYLVRYYFTTWLWSIHVKIGIGFKAGRNALFIRPFIYGRVRGSGYTERKLKFGLRITKVTFHPKIVNPDEYQFEDE